MIEFVVMELINSLNTLRDDIGLVVDIHTVVMVVIDTLTWLWLGDRLGWGFTRHGESDGERPAAIVRG